MTPETRREFVLESRDHLLHFEQSLLALEKIDSTADRKEQINRSLRAIHSLKGDAGFLGFTPLRTLAHAMESLLEGYRTGAEPVPTAVVEALLVARDRLAALVEDLEHCHESDLAPILARLDQASAQVSGDGELRLPLAQIAQATGPGLVRFFRDVESAGGVQSPRLEGVPALDQDLATAAVVWRGVCASSAVSGELGRHVGRMPAAREERPATMELELPLKSLVDANGGLVRGFRSLEQLGTWTPDRLELEIDALIHQIPHLLVPIRGRLQTQLSQREVYDRLGLAADLPTPPVVSAALVDVPPAVVVREPEPASAAASLAPVPAAPRVDAGLSAAVQAPSAASTVVSGNNSAESGTSAQQRSAASEPAAVPPPPTERLTSLRVNVELLDRMMTLVGELTLVRNQSLLAFAGEEGGARAIIQRLNSVTSELQETVLRTRMQPVGNLFGKFPRMVRDLARQLGKQVEIVTIGREVELDKTVLEQLSDPLTHLLRNSIDHGLEIPEERVARGKPAQGTVTLSATPADGQVLIEIRDDGRGIDPDAIRNKALSQRLKTAAELDAMSRRELYSLILLPGFSTARQVTDVSGRGVGMDVVKTNIEQLEGSLTIDSTPGEGTSMLLRVPLTLAIIPCLIVEVGADRFAIPQRELEEIVCLHPGGKGAIEHAFDTEVYRLRDRLLPIVRFQEVLDRRRPFDAAAKAGILTRHPPAERDAGRIEYILVLRSRGRRFGLLVDQVRGTQEVVVKPMHPAMKRVGVFSGATLMGDGQVALIANVEGIVDHSNCFVTGLRSGAAETVTQARDPREVHRVLIFEYGPREQFALPLVQIRRLELIQSSQIETIGDKEFITLDGVATRVVRLDQVLRASRPEPRGQMYLILPKFVAEPMGILVTRIIDTDTLAIELQPAAADEPGVLGTALIRDRLSLFLDVQKVREVVFGTKPLLADPQENPSVPAPPGRRVLLIDDTPFFREVVRRYLEADGIEITTAVDGADGLQKLAEGHFDLVVCDIEMPNLDGWGFAREARERGCRLPLLALTSLSKQEHEARALATGFSEFQEKLDHDQLLRAVRRLLRESPAPVLVKGRP
jgi:two-component system chemotaxis sensor kinase CheA